MKHRIALEYTIPTGDLTPYFEALQSGRALASECNHCGTVAFPARTTCGACGGAVSWLALPGTAQILFRTDAGARSYALVKFDGVDTATTVALTNPENTALSGTLAVPLGDAPGLWLRLAQTPKGDEHEH